MEQKQRIRWWWNIPIIFLIGILIPLGVRSVVTDDNRYGWGTFSKQVAFRVNYYWVSGEGKKIKYRPGKELSGKVRKKLKRSGTTRYSDGALRSWIRNYADYMYKNQNTGGEMKAFRAELLYRINSGHYFSKGSEGTNFIVIEYPEQPGD